MKDYSLNFIEQTGFILSYTKEGNQIILNIPNTPDVEKPKIPNTRENEEKVIQKMECQVTNSRKFKKKTKERKNKSIKLAVASAMTTGAGVCLVPTLPMAGVTLATGSIIIFLTKFVETVNAHFVLQDMKKNKLFVKNKVLFNQCNLKTASNIFNNINESTKQKFTQIAENQGLTVNELDKFSLREIETIYGNLLREDTCKFNYQRLEGDFRIEEGQGLIKKYGE